MHGFLAQASLHFSNVFESAVHSMATADGDDDSADDGTFKVSYVGFADSVTGEGMEEKVMQYFAATAVEFSRHRVCTIVCDKANPSVMSLSNGAISFPNGKIALLAPQASRFVVSVTFEI